MADEDPQPAGFGIPAVFANRFQIRIEGSTSRIVFGDAIVGKHAANHTHIVMRTEDLEEMGVVIGQLIAKAKKQK